MTYAELHYHIHDLILPWQNVPGYSHLSGKLPPFECYDYACDRIIFLLSPDRTKCIGAFSNFMGEPGLAKEIIEQLAMYENPLAVLDSDDEWVHCYEETKEAQYISGSECVLIFNEQGIYPGRDYAEALELLGLCDEEGDPLPCNYDLKTDSWFVESPLLYMSEELKTEELCRAAVQQNCPDI